MAPKKADFAFKPGMIAIVKPKVERPDFPPWPVLMLPDIKSIKVKSVRDILYDAPKEDGPVPVMYLGEDIYGMVQEREVYEFSPENLEMPKITTKAKRQERDDAEKVAWGLLKLTTEERLEYLLDPKGAKKKRKGGGVVGSEAPSSDTAAASPGSAKKQKKAENIPASSNVSQTSPAGGPRDDVSDDGTLVEGPIRDQDTGEWLCPKCRRKDVRKALVRCSAKTTCMQYLCAIHDDDIICKGSRGSDDLVFVCDKHALKQHLTCQGCESIICLAPECPASTSTTRPGCAKWTCQRKEHRLCGECLDNTEMKKNKDAPCPYCASSEA